jgi:hypothetical protein
MIQLAEDIEYLDFRKVPLNPKFKRVFIEVASNNKIDIAVVDADELSEFDESETGEDVDIDWIVSLRNYDFEFEFPDSKAKYYLLFWNSNEEDDAFVAYKITPMT